MEINKSKTTQLPPFKKRLLSRTQSIAQLHDKVNERDTDLKYPTIRRLLNGRIDLTPKLNMDAFVSNITSLTTRSASNLLAHEIINNNDEMVSPQDYDLNNTRISPMLIQVLIYTTLGIKLPKMNVPYDIEDDATYLTFRIEPKMSIPMSTSNIIIRGVNSKILTKATTTTITIDGTDKTVLELRVRDVTNSGIMAIIKTGTYQSTQQLKNGIFVTSSDLMNDVNLGLDSFTYGTMLINGVSPLLISQWNVLGNVNEHDINNSEALIKSAATFIADNIDSLNKSDVQELLQNTSNIPNFDNLRDTLDAYIAFKFSSLNERFVHIEERLKKQLVDTDMGPMEVDLPDKLKHIDSNFNLVESKIADLTRQNSELVSEINSQRKIVLNLERQLQLKLGNGNNSDVVYFGNNLGRSVTNILIGNMWAGTDINGVYASTTPDWQLIRTHIVKKVDTNSFIVVADLTIRNLMPLMVHILRYNNNLTKKYGDDNLTMITKGYLLVYEVRTAFGQYLVYRLRPDFDVRLSGVINLASVILCGTPKFDVTSVVIP